MEEYFDIVDEKNVPIGEKRSREEAHSQGLWHRAVHIYLFRKNNNAIDFLVHLRSKTKDLNPNMWDTRFGGHVKTGETVEDTALEELKEEIGVNVQISDLIFGDVYKHDGFPNREFNIVYYYNFQGDITSLKFNDGEVQEIKWMETQEIIQSMRNTPGNWTGKSEKFLKIVEILIAKMNS
ncbi:MAG: NUDIX domain-containing protein [Patescibacteria group bacterium]